MTSKEIETSKCDGDLASSPSDPATGPASELPAAQVVQPAMAQQGGTMVGLGVQFSNPEVELVKKLQPEHITLEMKHQHERAMRRLENESRELDALREDRGRISQDRNASDKRLLAAFYVVFGAVFAIVFVLVFRGAYDQAMKVGGGVVTLAVALAGGMGIERVRQDRKRNSDS